MMSAYGEGTKFVGNNNMRAAIKDTEDAQLSHTGKNKVIWQVVAVSLLSVSLLAYFFLR